MIKMYPIVYVNTYDNVDNFQRKGFIRNTKSTELYFSNTTLSQIKKMYLLGIKFYH